MNLGSRTTAVAFVLLTLQSLGCSADRRLVYPELDEGSLVALLYLDLGARLLAASGLVSSNSPLEIEVDAPPDDARRVLLCGFDPEVIAGFTDLSHEELAASTLRLAGSNRPALPEPAFWADSEFETDPPVLRTADPNVPFPLRLGAGWLPECDRSLEDFKDPLLRLSCGSEACEASVALVGCNLQIETNLCTPSAITARVGTARGELGPPNVTGALTQCTNVSARSGALYSMDCGGTGAPCLLDVFPSGLTPQPAIVAQASAPLLDVVQLEAKPKVEDIHGYLSGLAHSGTRVLVSSFDGALDDRRCASVAPTRLFVLSADRLEVIATATAPPCLTAIVGDLAQGGFIGIVGNPAERIVRIDESAKIVDSRPLPPEITAPLIATVGLFDDAPLARNEPALVVFAFGPSRGRARSYLVAFDAGTFAVRQIFTSEADRVDRMQDYVAVVKGGKYHEYLVLDRHHEEIWSFIIDDLEDPALFPLSICGQSGTPVELANSQPLTALFLSYENERGAVGFYGLRGDTLCSRLAPFEIPADPTAIRNWQGSRVEHLVGLRRTAPDGDHRAYVAFFDSELPGFRPGLLEVGYGDVGPFVGGPSGAVFATLPWTARVLRIEPAP